MEYQYQAVGRDGEALRGTLEAASPADVVRQLAGEGRTAVQVRTHVPRIALPVWRSRLRAADLVVALRGLATLLGSGVALADAVAAQSRGSGRPVLAAAFEGIGQELACGKSFGEAVRESGLPLPEHVHQRIEAGERSGELPRSLREAAEQLESHGRAAAKVRGALTYPAILAASGIAAVLLVFVVVAPKFADLADLQESKDQPLIASVVFGAGVWFNQNIWLFVGLLVAAALGVAVLWRSRRARSGVANGLSAVPVVGAWLAEADTAKWASAMAAMLFARVELMDGLALAARGVRVSRRRARLEEATAEVKSGSALSAALEKHRALTPAGYNVIRVGEESGKLAEMMRALATLYQENSARRTKRIKGVLALVELLAIVLIGGVLAAALAVLGHSGKGTSVQEHDAAFERRQYAALAELWAMDEHVRDHEVFVAIHHDALAAIGITRDGLRYYLSGAVLRYGDSPPGSERNEDFTISRKRVGSRHLLTPDNRFFFLYDSVAAVDEITDAHRRQYAALAAAEPMARAPFDIHLREGHILYARANCSPEDATGRFLLHVVPVDVEMLPPTARFGFDNLDFRFSAYGVTFDDKCLAEVPLPSYPIASVRTGRLASEQGPALWQVAFPVPPRQADSDSARPALK